MFTENVTFQNISENTNKGLFEMQGKKYDIIFICF